MKNNNDFSSFDRPEILNYVFHPRGDFSSQPDSPSMRHLRFEVDQGVKIGATFHPADTSAPVILFFHGNGEIVSDYDDLGPVFAKIGVNFFPFDYRGYGKSSGTPTFTAMMNDCHILFEKAKSWLIANDFTGPIIVMGRSLGSASALELASVYQDDIDGLIIESGFAFIMPLMKLLGISTDFPGVTEDSGPRNYEKIKYFKKPTLIIHAEFDHIIPFSDGETIYNNSTASSKKLLEIKNADHNSIFYQGFSDYMKAIENLTKKL